ncbi:hypothetical protein IWQ48_005307 [Labrenzia sp. EL_13]|nr:hypothetical protein [Labrenzia sp. EL_13]
MAWRVDLNIDEFTRKFEFGPDGPDKMASFAAAEPKLLPSQLPKRIVVSGAITNCNWFVMAAGGGEWIVSKRFKDIVEALEPGIHNLLPVNLVSANYKPISEPYFIFQIGQILDSIIFERTVFNSGVSSDGEHYVNFPLTNHLMTFEKEKIVGKHVWKEKYASERDFFFSNELVNTLDKLGFKKCFTLLDCREEVAP